MAAAQQRIFLGVSGMQKAEQAGLSLSDDAVQAQLNRFFPPWIFFTFFLFRKNVLILDLYN